MSNISVTDVLLGLFAIVRDRTELLETNAAQLNLFFYNQSKNPKYASLLSAFRFDTRDINPICQELYDAFGFTLPISRLTEVLGPRFERCYISNSVSDYFSHEIKNRLSTKDIENLGELAESLVMHAAR